MKINDDLDAVREIVGILQEFESADRQRIYRWVGEKLGITSPSKIERNRVANGTGSHLNY